MLRVTDDVRFMKAALEQAWTGEQVSGGGLEERRGRHVGERSCRHRDDATIRKWTAATLSHGRRVLCIALGTEKPLSR
jgi:hypothetical protein